MPLLALKETREPIAGTNLLIAVITRRFIFVYRSKRSVRTRLVVVQASRLKVPPSKFRDT